MKKRNIFSLIFVIGFLALSAFAKETSVEGLYEYKLDNGLELYIAENHTVPLAYIEIAVKAGAVTQTPETAGLFHLYEHMMFKGNALYKDAASVQNAISELGVSSWNGTTGIDRVNYFFTVPSDRIEEGLAFWNAAIRSPLMDKTEFEKEKKVVLAEIEGGKSEPGKILGGFIRLNLFPEAPYRIDPSGSFDVVRNATVAQMRDMQSKFYIPCNAALFVGGDVDPEETYNLVKKIYGSWSNNGNSAPANGPKQKTKLFDERKLCVMAHPQISPNMAEVIIEYRGPDTDHEIEDTYPVDYLCELCADPDGTFKRKIMEKKNFIIPDQSYVSAGYGTVRASGIFEFDAVMMNPEIDIGRRTVDFADAIEKEIIDAILKDENNFTDERMNLCVESLLDSRIRSGETASGLLGGLSRCWENSSAEYYYSYIDKISKVKKSEVEACVEKYLRNKPLVVLIVNPEVYEKQKLQFEKLGFETITEEKSCWWKLPEFAPKNTDVKISFREDKNIYSPSKIKSENYSKRKQKEISNLKLKNGIPVYINRTSSKIISLNVAFRSGIKNLTAETCGLEKSLFNMMSSCSKKYSYDERKKIFFETSASISSVSRVNGSIMRMNVMNKDMDKILPVFADGIINPSYEKIVYENMINDYKEMLHAEKNKAESLLQKNISEQIYEGHAYGVTVGVTDASLKNITINAMKKYHNDILASDNMFIVVCGDVDEKEIVKKLNEMFGKIKKRSSKNKKNLVVAELEIPKTAPQVYVLPSVAGTAYIARVFKTPAGSSEDFIPACLAADIYSTVMFNVVREKNGICYTPSSYIGSSEAPLGFEYLFKVSDFERFRPVVDEARDYMKQGKLVDGISEDGTYVFADLKDKLEGYKNSFINSTYQSQQTSSSVGFNLAYNILRYNDMHHDEKIIEDLRKCSAEDILRVFNEYWCDAGNWYAVTGPEDAEKLKFYVD